MIRRFLYIFYYLYKMDWQKLNQFLTFASSATNKSRIHLFLLSIADSIKFKISILEYFHFRFFCIGKEEKKNWAGTGFLYEYQLKMNPRNKRNILDDKRKFYKSYEKFFIHKVYNINELKNNFKLRELLLRNKSEKLVFKVSDGKCGAQVKIRESKDFSENSVLDYMQKNHYDMVEEFIHQHSVMNKLSPSAVNTVRIFTQLNCDDEVDILGCRLRISVKSSVDNLAAGNLAAPIDEKTGIVNGNGVYSDITKQDEIVHPVTKTLINGFQIPFWEDTVQLAKNAALLHKQNRSIGWDIVITENGPGLIEGNHDWCKLLWQLPVKKGLKSLLYKYIN